MAVCGQLSSEGSCIFFFSYHWAFFFLFQFILSLRKKYIKIKNWALWLPSFSSKLRKETSCWKIWWMASFVLFSVQHMRALLLEWGQIPQAVGSLGLKGDLVILWGRGKVGVSGFPLSSRKHLFAFSRAHPSYLSVILCVFSTFYWRGYCLFLRKHHWYNVGLSAFKLWFSQLPQLLTYLTVGSCMVEGSSQFLMCKQTLRLLALFLLYCCLVTKWFGRAKEQSLSSLSASQPQSSPLWNFLCHLPTCWN